MTRNDPFWETYKRLVVGHEEEAFAIQGAVHDAYVSWEFAHKPEDWDWTVTAERYVREYLEWLPRQKLRETFGCPHSDP